MGIGTHQHPIRGRTDEWLTPPNLLEKLGPFDLDPCSPVDRPWPTAARHYSILDDGLSYKWTGRVWLNPPYGPKAAHWLKRLRIHGNGIALIFARTETHFFQDEVFAHAHAILFLRGRLTFYSVEGQRAKFNGGAPSVLIAYGSDNAESLKRSGIRGAYVELRAA